MGLKDVFVIMKNLVKAMKPADKIVACLNDQQSKGTDLSPRLRNAMAMYELSKKDSSDSDPDPKDLLSFRDTAWYYLDILDELEAHPDLLPADLAETFGTYKTCVRAAQEAADRSFEKQRPKWEKKHNRKYRPQPIPNLIGEPLE